MVFLRCTRYFHSTFCSVLQPSSVRGPVTPTADVLSPSIPAVSPRAVCVCDGTGRRRTKSRRGRAVAAAPRPARRGRVAGDDAVSPGAAAGAPSATPPATSASASSARSAAPDASATTTSDRGRTAAVHHHRVRVHTSARRRTRASFDVCEIKRVC